MEELNKRIGAKARKKYLPLMIIGLIMLLAGAALLGSAIITGSDVEDLNTLTEDQLRTGNTYALVDNNLLIDVFATDNSGAYIILYRSSDSKYMGLYLKGSKKRTGESIIEENRKYLTDEADSLSSRTISVKGKLTAMTGDEKQYFQEYFTDGGWSLEEVDRSVDYRTLNTSEDDSMMIIFAVVFVLIGLGLTIYAVRQLAGGFKSKISEQMSAQGLSAERASAELSGAQKFGGVDLAQTFALISGSKAEIVTYENLVWAYKFVHTTQHKIYGIIPAGKSVTYSVVLFDCRKQKYTIGCRNEAEADSILKALSTLAPHVIIGYSDELQNVADSNYQQMIDESARRKTM